MITTTKDVPMQVDGEPVMMKPCRIEISLGNHSSAPSAKMLVRNKTATCKNDAFDSFQERLKLKKLLENYPLAVLETQMAICFLQRSILNLLITIHFLIIITNMKERNHTRINQINLRSKLFRCGKRWWNRNMGSQNDSA